MDDKQYLENIESLIEKSMINKVNELEQSVIKNYKFIDTYELTNPIIHRHFLIETFEEINEELEKHNRQFRIDFDNDAYDYFDKRSYYHLKKEVCITDGGFLYFKKGEEIYALNLLIKACNNDKELKFLPKSVKSRLPIYSIGLCY